MIKYILIGISDKDANKIQKVFSEESFFNYAGNFMEEDLAMEEVLKVLPHLVFIQLENIKNPYRFLNECNKYLNEQFNYIACSHSIDNAYKAIKNLAIDYLLSPLTTLELRKALLIYNKKFITQDSKRICLKSYNDFHYIELEDIVMLKADNNTTDFILVDGKTITSYKTLKVFEDSLPKNFLRVHNSYIINKQYVTRVNFGKNLFSLGECHISIPFTKTYLENVNQIKSSLEQKAFLHMN
jgi:DNA-binding LytR/AlgR family response regulator